jgi:hypothetical protein
MIMHKSRLEEKYLEHKSRERITALIGNRLDFCIYC